MVRQEVQAIRSFFRMASDNVELTTIPAYGNFAGGSHLIFMHHQVFLNKPLYNVNLFFLDALPVSLPYFHKLTQKVLVLRSVTRDGRALIVAKRKQILFPVIGLIGFAGKQII